MSASQVSFETDELVLYEYAAVPPTLTSVAKVPDTVILPWLTDVS
jgi:hypothetical protein